MADCLFCRIASGALPTDLVHESPAAVALLEKLAKEPRSDLSALCQELLAEVAAPHAD